MKKLAILLTLLMVVTSIAVAGCGRQEPNTDYLPRPVPHALDVRFENCNVCHVSDQLSVENILHADFTNDMCAQTGCHGARVYERPNPTPSAVSRPMPHVATSPLDNCIACHLPSKGSAIHQMLTDNFMCLTPICHGASVPIAPPTTSPPTTTDPATPVVPTGEPPTQPPTSPSGNAPVLDKPALALEGANHLAASASMCMFCHMPGAGVNQYPMAPAWDGSVKSPGPWTITAGSDADHTNRTDTASCVAAGCHAKNW